jgi:anti-sigma28 factor (negative regulator of flagellin synthesis)
MQHPIKNIFLQKKMATKKTTKGVSTTRSKKTAASVKPVKERKAKAPKSEPTEEQIRKKAEEIYHERIARGEYGTAEDDWRNAERLLKGIK